VDLITTDLTKEIIAVIVVDQITDQDPIVEIVVDLTTDQDPTIMDLDLIADLTTTDQEIMAQDQIGLTTVLGQLRMRQKHLINRL
jgi:hypothetical protein